MSTYQIETLGWIAMVITISSFAFTNMRILRGMNILGCALWITYGGLISSPQIIITNLAIVSIHGIWFLRNRKKD